VKKTAIALFVSTIAVALIISVSFNFGTVKAGSGDNDYSIEFVTHTIEVMPNGYVFINDTIRILGNASDGAATLDHFNIGFPYEYGSHVLRCLAYDASGFFNVTLSVPLESRVGFYAVRVSFPQPLNMSVGAAHVFTVGFILSNNLLIASDTDRYVLDIPAYPSLTKATTCNVKIVLPEEATEITVAKEDGPVNASSFKTDLPAFVYSPASITFSLVGDKIQLIDIKELKREVRIGGLSEMEGSDSYHIESKTSKQVSAIEIFLPPNASDPSAQDQFGRKMPLSGWLNENISRYRVAFELPLEGYKSARFTVRYYLPNKIYITTQEETNSFNFTSLLFQNANYYIDQASVTIILPEGAKMRNPEETLIGGAYSLERGIFQETATITKQGISPLEGILPSENAFEIVYEYNPLWLSFRPTLWIWTFAIIGLTITIILKRPKVPARVTAIAVPTVAMGLRSEYIKSFVEAYEEKRKATLEIASLETRVRKGKIPRRRYKVQRRTIETRLDSLSRSLEELKEKMRGAGGHYMDLMRQLEIAETEINEVEANIRSIEARYGRGELSLEAYRKLLADYQRRKEKADTTINGTLIRLREEIR